MLEGAGMQITEGDVLLAIMIAALVVVLVKMMNVLMMETTAISVRNGGTTITEEQVRSLFFLWNEALHTLDSSVVAKRYAKNAVLLPTVSDTPRTDYESIKDYFDSFLKKRPSGTILDGKILLGPNWAQDAGVYEFVMGCDGSRVKARYTFIYVLEDGRWRISHHHSSVMPEGITIGAKITVSEVRALFELWNDALATLDSKAVANRYSNSPVLLPTVSDTPRTDYGSIKQYFDAFLKKKPQGVILESNVTIGTNWAEDAGIYEFTLRGAGYVKVKARYTFIYVYEEGQWKIQHHHSSIMPESIPPSPQPITKTEVRNLFNLWNDALATLDPDIVAKRYSREAVLLPTVSDLPRNTYGLIRDYFESFLKKKPQGVILSGDIIIGNCWAQDAGIYEFTLGVDGSVVKARYSFIYVYEDGRWKIAHHHSSVMPEAFLAAATAKPANASSQPITQSEVRSLFNLWNDALASLDSDKVARRYSRDSVLLPTVSDTPRTNYAMIKAYFDNFLKKKPQGVILSGNILIGHNWAQDAGVYEFTMGCDGTVVKARYTFVYIYEEGEWKISHHHSSIMPEGMLSRPEAPEPITTDQVRALFSKWNDALATLDAEKVAQRYSKNPVLLPTVSDKPRTNHSLIKNYFESFLLKKPQGTIQSGEILIGHNWAQDAGIYVFTMGCDGSVVQARYTFIYVFEDGEWKISHHHSSLMPESFLSAADNSKKQ